MSKPFQFFLIKIWWNWFHKCEAMILRLGQRLWIREESANLFFIVHEGLVEVSVKKFFFWEKKVATLKAGEFFGESVLVSNSKRTATVKALTDNSCFVLLKASFKSTLNHNSLFKENMKVVFARRKRQLQRTWWATRSVVVISLLYTFVSLRLNKKAPSLDLRWIQNGPKALVRLLRWPEDQVKNLLQQD